MQQVTIETRITGVHFGCYAVVLGGGETLYETDVFPFGMPHVARRRAEDECLRRGWDDPSSERMRAIRAADARVRAARTSARQFARENEGHYLAHGGIVVDHDGYLGGPLPGHEMLHAALAVPGMLESAIELRMALIAREQLGGPLEVV